MVCRTRRQRTRHKVQRKLALKREIREQFRPTPVTLGSEAFEAKGMVSIGLGHSPEAESRLALSTGTAETRDFLRQVARGF